MQGKTVVITGATSGIGQVAAEKLAAMGARIVLVARDRARAEAALDRLHAGAPGIAHAVHYADLSLMAETRRVAAEIAAAEPRIDVLVNNAGAIFAQRHVTEEGLERTFALNHMSYFLMAAGLRERLVATPRCAHRQCRVRRASQRASRLQRSAAREKIQAVCGLWHDEALQHPVHARTGAPACWHRRHRQLPASGICGDAVRRSVGPAVLARRAHRQTWCDLAGAGREDDNLSRVVAGRCECFRRIFLQIVPRNAKPRSAETMGYRKEIVGRERKARGGVALTPPRNSLSPRSWRPGPSA